MDNKNQIVKKVVATTLAANVLMAGGNVFETAKVALAWEWPWSSKHTAEEIGSIYSDVERDLQDCMELSKDIDDAKKAEPFIKSVMDMKNEVGSLEKNYKNAVKVQEKVRKLQNEISLEHNLQEIERRRKLEEAEQEAIRLENERRRKLEEAEQEAIRLENERRRKLEEAEQEAIRIENEHRRKLEEAEEQHRREMEAQKLLMEKEERDRLEVLNNAKASISEKFFAVKRKVFKDVEMQENIDHLNVLAAEIDSKIESIDNLNRVDSVEDLITEFLAEVDVILAQEAKFRQEEFEKKLKESKEKLTGVVLELQDLLSNLDAENEHFEHINNAIESYESIIDALNNLDDANDVKKGLDELHATINSLLELQAKIEEEKRALEQLESQIENSRDPKAQLEMLSEGKISIDDVVGGNQKAKSKAVALVKSFERYNKGGKIVPSKGLLLYGPPGTGKTSFVNAFAAEQGIELFFINPSLVMGDNGERKVLETFEQAKKAAQVSGEPVILLIDEVDAIAQKRSSSSSDKVLVMLMNEIDKLKATDNVIIFATTNRREALDTAIIRSGRLDQSVEVGLPNTDDKEKIVNIYLKNLKVDENLNVKAFIDKMRGFCGADIKRTIDIAINSAMDRQNVDNLCEVVIGNMDLQEGISTVMDEKTTVY